MDALGRRHRGDESAETDQGDALVINKAGIEFMQQSTTDGTSAHLALP